MAKVKSRKLKLSHRTAILILVTQFTVLSVFCLFVNSQLTKTIRSNTINSMTTLTSDRSMLIKHYISEAESYLTAYSRAGEITVLLKDPTNAEKQAAA